MRLFFRFVSSRYPPFRPQQHHLLSVPVRRSFHGPRSACSHARSAKMSWMDSWSRPSKHDAIPPPYYLLYPDSSTDGSNLYCRSCGRVIGGGRKKGSGNAGKDSGVKYCSARCRNSKPGALDRRIETAFVRLLEGLPLLPTEGKEERNETDDESTATHTMATKTKGRKQTKTDPNKLKKGETRRIVLCSTVQEAVFGSASLSAADAAAAAAQEAVPEGDSDSDSPSASDADSTTSSKNLPPPNDPLPKHTKEETESLSKAGIRRAEVRERVRRAARRGCAFGFEVDENLDSDNTGAVSSSTKAAKRGKGEGNGEAGGKAGKTTTMRRKCEAVINGKVVESSFAKGEWGVRWRE